jgi:hypothetical protein
MTLRGFRIWRRQFCGRLDFVTFNFQAGRFRFFRTDARSVPRAELSQILVGTGAKDSDQNQHQLLIAGGHSDGIDFLSELNVPFPDDIQYAAMLFQNETFPIDFLRGN